MLAHTITEALSLTYIPQKNSEKRGHWCSRVAIVRGLEDVLQVLHRKYVSVFVHLCVCVDIVWQGRPCISVCGSHDSPGWHIHLCLFAKFDFKYLSHHTSWLKQIAGKVLLSVKHVVRRMEALEGTSMFHLVKYMSGKCMCNYSTF